MKLRKDINCGFSCWNENKSDEQITWNLRIAYKDDDECALKNEILVTETDPTEILDLMKSTAYGVPETQNNKLLDEQFPKFHYEIIAAVSIVLS